MRLNTKEKRLKYRKLYLTEGTEIIDMPEIEFQAYINEKATNNGNMYYYLTTFTGTAGRPDMNYYYTSKERRDAALQKAIDDQKKRLECRAKRKEENKGKLTGAAVTAAAIRKQLKKEFPGIKFSVTSSNFSGGNSVSIHWTDGPRLQDVNNITKQYQYGYFDGMTDCYEYREISKDLGCPGAKFVSTQRELSPEYTNNLLAAFEAAHGYRYNINNGNTWEAVNKIEHDYPELMPYQYTMNQPKPVTQEEELITETKQSETQQPDPAPVKPSNVIDITAKTKARQEQREADEAIRIFKKDYLPHLSAEDIQLLFNSPVSEYGAIIAKICMRIDLERNRG